MYSHLQNRDLFPVCRVEVHRYIKGLTTPFVSSSTTVNRPAFFLKAADSSKAHIMTTASTVVGAKSIYLEVYTSKGRWLRCLAAVESSYDAQDVATLKLIDDDLGKKNEFLKIVSQRAIELLPKNLPLKQIVSAHCFAPTMSKQGNKKHDLKVQKFIYKYGDFSQEPYLQMHLTSLSENLEIGAPCMIELDQKPYILGLLQSTDSKNCYVMPWLSLKNILQMTEQGLRNMGLCGLLCNMQHLENSVARAYNGLTDVTGGVRIAKIFPESRLLEEGVRVGDILLKVNNFEVSGQGLIHYEDLQTSLSYQHEVQQTLPGGQIKLDLGRPTVDAVTNARTLKRFTILITNDRFRSSLRLHKPLAENEIIILSGYVFFAQSFQELSAQKHKTHPRLADINYDLQLTSTNGYRQAIILGELPADGELGNFAGRWITKVDGKRVNDFAEFRSYVEQNIRAGNPGVSITLVESSADKLKHPNGFEGFDIYIKHKTPQENAATSVKRSLPLNLFLSTGNIPARHAVSVDEQVDQPHLPQLSAPIESIVCEAKSASESGIRLEEDHNNSVRIYRDAVCKIEVSLRPTITDPYSPYYIGQYGGSCSFVKTRDNGKCAIVTAAHTLRCAEDLVLLLLLPNGEILKCGAFIKKLFSCVDLALLEPNPNDPNAKTFQAEVNARALPLYNGNLSIETLKTKPVTICGYQLAGLTIEQSETHGNITTLESMPNFTLQYYEHQQIVLSFTNRLNSGFSGSPLIINEKNPSVLGVVHQMYTKQTGDIFGNSVPWFVIKLLLDAYENDKLENLRGIGIFPCDYQELTTEHREALGMQPNQSGVRISHIPKNSVLRKPDKNGEMVQAGDIVLGVDNQPFTQKGQIFDPVLGISLEFSYFAFARKPLGEKIKLTIGRPTTVNHKPTLTIHTITVLNLQTYTDFYLVKERISPIYYFAGGITFCSYPRTLFDRVIALYKGQDCPKFLTDLMRAQKNDNIANEAVIIFLPFEHPLLQQYPSLRPWAIVTHVNNEEIRDLHHLRSIVVSGLRKNDQFFTITLPNDEVIYLQHFPENLTNALKASKNILSLSNMAPSQDNWTRLRSRLRDIAHHTSSVEDRQTSINPNASGKRT